MDNMDRIDRMKLKQKIQNGERISEKEASALYDWPLIDLAKAGNARRKTISPSEEVGFIINRIINFTNVCEAQCNFCAFHARANMIKPYEMTMDQILSEAEKLEQAGGSQIMLQGGLHPNYTLDKYAAMVSTVKRTFPGISLHCFSPAELVHLSRKESLELDETVKALKDAGLDSVPGASDMLVDDVRQKASPNKITVDQWREAMFALHRNGMKSSATMTYGMGETREQQIEHLSVVRDVQNQTGIIRAFIPWSFSPKRTRMEHIQPATGIEYLKIVAISRIFLDNIVCFQAGWLTEGLRPAQVALAFGANDMGGILMREEVVKATGIETKAGVEEFVDIIRDAGKIPVLRDSDYRVIKRYRQGEA